MAVTDTDLIMIERAGTLFKATFADVAANLGSAALEDYADGSNSDGYWLRIGDIQICWKAGIAMGSITAAGSGTWASPYRTNGVSISWPQAFTAAPAAFASFSPVSAATLDNRAITINAFQEASTTGWNFIRASKIGGDSSSFDVLLTVAAIGPWQ